MEKKTSVVARESQHTALPWRVFDFADVSEGRHEGVWVGADTPKDHPYFGHSKHIQILSDEDYPAKRVDAEFIVRACNAHTKLVEALQAAQLVIELKATHNSQDIIRLLESAGDYESGGHLSREKAIEEREVIAATLIEQALRLAQGKE